METALKVMEEGKESGTRAGHLSQCSSCHGTTGMVPLDQTLASSSHMVVPETLGLCLCFIIIIKMDVF